jgi:hypothetical protein
LVNLKAVIQRPPLIVNTRPGRVIHDRPLYGKQFCGMEFICVPLPVDQTFQFNGRQEPENCRST